MRHFLGRVFRRRQFLYTLLHLLLENAHTQPLRHVRVRSLVKALAAQQVLLIVQRLRSLLGCEATHVANILGRVTHGLPFDA